MLEKLTEVICQLVLMERFSNSGHSYDDILFYLHLNRRGILNVKKCSKEDIIHKAFFAYIRCLLGCTCLTLPSYIIFVNAANLLSRRCYMELTEEEKEKQKMKKENKEKKGKSSKKKEKIKRKITANKSLKFKPDFPQISNSYLA